MNAGDNFAPQFNDNEERVVTTTLKDGRDVSGAKLDVAFLQYLLDLEHILNTTGWSSKRHLQSKVRLAVFTLEDNGYDGVVSAILRGFGVDRNRDMFSRGIDE